MLVLCNPLCRRIITSTIFQERTYMVFIVTTWANHNLLSHLDKQDYKPLHLGQNILTTCDKLDNVWNMCNSSFENNPASASEKNFCAFGVPCSSPNTRSPKTRSHEFFSSVDVSVCSRKHGIQTNLIIFWRHLIFPKYRIQTFIIYFMSYGVKHMAWNV